MMNNKGFTLIELLATIVILSILLAIIALNFGNIFSSTRDKVFNTYIESMRDATIEYIVDTGEMPTKTQPLYIRLAYLVGEEERLNPLSGKMEKAKPAYLDPFQNPSSDDKCLTNSFIKVELDLDNEGREKTDDKGRTDNNKRFKYSVCLKCDNYTSEGCNE